jgi:hypothetical protein
MPRKLPIGRSDFKTVIEDGYYYVDKSLLIKEVLNDSAQVLLLPRPRRFGKTLNMQMLRHFFELTEEDSGSLFQDLAVAEEPEVMAHQGQYPVLYFSLKEIRGTTWEVAYGKLQQLMCAAATEFSSVESSLSPPEGKRLRELTNETASQAVLENSLRDLAIWVQQHHKKPVIILIDEYDTPLLEAYAHNYYEEMASFMRSWLGGGLKLEAAPGVLFKAVVTGIMRVAKESLFSGLNNLKVWPVYATSPFSDKFGFTEPEVEKLLQEWGRTDETDVVRDWYNGYQFGASVVYNPWSIINYISEDNGPLPFWLNTSKNDLIYEALQSPTEQLRRQLEILLAGGEIRQTVTDAAVLREGVSPRDLWSFMLSAGYLTSRGSQMGPRGPEYLLAIPNRELRCIFSETVERWLERVYQSEGIQDFLETLVDGRWQRFEELLQRHVLNMLSFHDLGADKPAEAVIQAFVLGLLADLTHLYQIRSNREEGAGRADIVMNPFDKNQRGFVIEFKSLDQDADLDDALNAALKQIDEQQYATGLEADGVKEIVKLAIVLQGKTIKMKVA